MGPRPKAAASAHLLDLASRGDETATGLFLHGTAISFGGKGVLFLGPSGSGKSSLALALMAHGALLVSDDGVFLTQVTDAPHRLKRPQTAPQLIEARGIGLLHSGPLASHAALDLVVDLGQVEPERLPPDRRAEWKSQTCRLILGKDQPFLWAYLLQTLKAGVAVS